MLYNRYNLGIVDSIFDSVIGHGGGNIGQPDTDVNHKLIAYSAFLFEDSDMTVYTESFDDY